MANDNRPHHISELVVLHVEAHRVECASRPPLPINQMYPMDMLETRLHVKPQAFEQPETSRGSMFFKGSRRGLKDDPFLQRLSRLN